MSYEHILYELDDNILTITLNRPDKLNAFTGTMLRELIDAMDRADADDEVKAIIFTGAGRGFCAGADLSRGEGTFNYDQREVKENAPRRDGGGVLTLRLFESLKPLICACNGPAVGIGATMQLAMDVRFASETARYGFVFAKRGIVPDAASSWFLPRIVGVSNALEWCYSGRIIDAEEALRGGLVRSLHSPDELLPAARELAREIASYAAPVSVALTRQLIWQMMCADHPMEAHKLETRGVAARGKTDDAQEGVRSFLEKRAPTFPNKVSADMPDFFPWWNPREFE